MGVCRVNDQRGDTIVEVLLSTAVLSLVLAGAFTLTNRATRLNQTANERTQVSNLMQREVELIKSSALQNATTDFWANFAGTSAPLDSGVENSNYCDLVGGSNPRINAFYMKSSEPPPTPADDPIPIKIVKSDSDIDPLILFIDNDDTDFFDIWVEAVNDTASPSKYTDFFVYACWEGIGGEAKQRSGLVLRLARE